MLTKEQILTLTLLKDIDVKGIGPKKIFSIAQKIDADNAIVDSCKDLHSIMRTMKEKAIKSVYLDDLMHAQDMARNVIERSEDEGIGLIGYYDEEFPRILRHAINEEGKEEPPLLLWHKGDLSVLKMPCIAVIGTREPTREGLAAGKYLAGEFAKRNFNIISGLALGCDTCGHVGALDVGGITTAILGNGLNDNSIYPRENAELAEDIVSKGGLLLSEYHIGQSVSSYALVARDRLQAGLAIATLVVQTGKRGGTMHAANTTLMANKPLYVIRYKDPITNFHEKCLGNKLLYDKGAKYISGDDDIDAICESLKNSIITSRRVANLTLFDDFD